MIPHVMHHHHKVLPVGWFGGSHVPIRLGLPQTPLEVFGTEVCVSSGLVTLQLAYRSLQLRLCHNPIIYW